ncbi:MAG: hypothetical protein FH762_15850 [Firmicutes bacterium]|nr:hypothetical protein [Bacillota bacterium]
MIFPFFDSQDSNYNAYNLFLILILLILSEDVLTMIKKLSKNAAEKETAGQKEKGEIKRGFNILPTQKKEEKSRPKTEDRDTE